MHLLICSICLDWVKLLTSIIRYGLVARISRSQTVVSNTTTRSEEAGVQFPVSEFTFAFELLLL
jgi:hypothetical protein